MVDEDILFNLMGNETRRMILQMLSSGPCYTTEIAEKLKIGQKAINEHMRLLQEAGIVDLYTQKQSRGSPRKYFRINKRVRLEFSMGPYRYDTESSELLEEDVDGISDDFPHLQKIMEEVKKSQQIREIGKLTRVMGNLNYELSKISQAKEYVECQIVHVRNQCVDICNELGLDDIEKRVVLELVNKGGKLSPNYLSEKLKIDEKDIAISLEKLKVKGLIKA